MLKISGLLISISFILVSCCGLHTEVRYTYENITVVRIDECGKTTFYYEDNLGEKRGEIWLKYSGINDGFEGYLEFNKYQKVTLFISEGYFEKENIDTSLFNICSSMDFVKNHSFASFDEIKYAKSTCNIAFPIHYEQNINDTSQTEVVIYYDID